MSAGGAIYLALLSWQLALSCLCMTTLLWAVALRFGAYSRASNRAYMAELANTNQVHLPGAWFQDPCRALRACCRRSGPSADPAHLSPAPSCSLSPMLCHN